MKDVIKILEEEKENTIRIFHSRIEKLNNIISDLESLEVDGRYAGGYVPGDLVKHTPKVKNNFWKNLFKKKKIVPLDLVPNRDKEREKLLEMADTEEVEERVTGNTSYEFSQIPKEAHELIAENPPEPEILKKPKKKSKSQQKTKSRIGVADKSSSLAKPQSKAKEKKEEKKYSTASGIGASRKYPLEMTEFIEENMEGRKNEEVCELIRKKFKVEITKLQLSSYMTYNNLRRGKSKIELKERRTKVEDEEKRGNSRKWPEELKSFVEEKINELKNPKLVIAINEEFDLDMTAQQFRSYKIYNNIQRNYNVKPEKKKIEKPKIDSMDLTINGEKVPIEIMEYVKKYKNKDPLLLRDEIIELFSQNYGNPIIKTMQNQFKEKKSTPLNPEPY